MSADAIHRVEATPSAPGERAQPEPEPFGPESLLWDLAGQHLYACATGSAFLMQVMHPAIGAVVGRLSTYRTDPWGRAARSFASVQTWVYGGAEALREGHRLREMHKGMTATDEQGRQHHALAAEPWAWVPLTGFHAAMVMSRYFMVEPLTPAQQRRIYQEQLHLCRILRVPERMLPPTVEDYQVYFDDMIENTLRNHPTAHDLLNTIDHTPPLPIIPKVLRPLWPPLGSVASGLNRFVTVGTLPPAAREKLGLRWTDSDERRLVAFGGTLARANQALPERLRYLPIAYHARRAARARQRHERALATRPL